MSCAVGRLNAPVSWNGGAAGFVSGPRMLNTVRTPMAWRIGRDRLHRRVVVRREQERETRGREAGAGGRLVQRQFEAELLEHVGAAGLARHRAIAVFDHVDAAGRGEQRRAGGEVEAARGIAARADDVDGARARGNRRPARQRAHGAREAAQLVGASRPWRAAPRAARPPARGAMSLRK